MISGTRPAVCWLDVRHTACQGVQEAASGELTQSWAHRASMNSFVSVRSQTMVSQPTGGGGLRPWQNGLGEARGSHLEHETRGERAHHRCPRCHQNPRLLAFALITPFLIFGASLSSSNSCAMAGTSPATPTSSSLKPSLLDRCYLRDRTNL